MKGHPVIRFAKPDLPIPKGGPAMCRFQFVSEVNIKAHMPKEGQKK
jgi:hypothetical protein